MKIISTFFILCSAQICMAQLSGTYTIGGSNPDYATLQEAVTDLGVQGVSASVNMLVRDGIYEEAFQIPSISGMGGDVWVTFKSESGIAENVIWQSAICATIGQALNYMSMSIQFYSSVSISVFQANEFMR